MQPSFLKPSTLSYSPSIILNSCPLSIKSIFNLDCNAPLKGEGVCISSSLKNPLFTSSIPFARGYVYKAKFFSGLLLACSINSSSLSLAKQNFALHSSPEVYVISSTSESSSISQLDSSTSSLLSLICAVLVFSSSITINAISPDFTFSFKRSISFKPPLSCKTIDKPTRKAADTDKKIPAYIEKTIALTLVSAREA
ncbi:hypothetical protein ANAPH2_00810 [Anaplasma phagocytophilum]|nr:hypothetical protein ANAPH2_00810 [Anaplasma phagocytophilum]